MSGRAQLTHTVSPFVNWVMETPELRFLLTGKSGKMSKPEKELFTVLNFLNFYICTFLQG